MRSTFIDGLYLFGSCNSSRGCGNCGKVLKRALFLAFLDFPYVEILWILAGEKSGEKTNKFSRRNRRHFHAFSTRFPQRTSTADLFDQLAEFHLKVFYGFDIDFYLFFTRHNGGVIAVGPVTSVTSAPRSIAILAMA